MDRGLDVAFNALDKEIAPVFASDLQHLEERLQVEIQIAVLPSGYDVDDMLREDASAWQTMLDGALPFMDYRIQVATARLDLSSAKGQSEAARSLVPAIRRMVTACNPIGGDADFAW